MPHACPPATVSPLQLLHWILEDDLDAAIEGGLMDYAGDDPDHDTLHPAYPQLRAQLLDAQQRLRIAWAARARHRARAARLALRAQARQARRTAPASAATTSPPLPSAAAAILARAKAKAARSPS